MLRSRLQKEVLKLYRQCLRAAEGKPGTANTVKAQFRTNASISKNETMRIEYLIRQGWRKLEMLQNPNTKGMGHFASKK